MENKKTLFINIPVTVLYAVVTFIFVMHHEIWADEAQAWLVAKNLSVFDFSLFKHLVNEGHPSFFYLLIMPFAKLNLQIIFMQILCWLATVAGVFLLLQYSPFNKFVKLAIITGGGFLYFFPVIARSYSILPLVIFLIATFYKKSDEHPCLYSILLAAAANTHVIMYGFSFLLGADFVYKNFEDIKNNFKKYIMPLFITVVSLIIPVVQLAGSEASNGSIEFNFNNIFTSFVRVIVQFFGGAINYIDTFMLNNMFTPPDIVLFVCATVLFIVLFCVLIAQLWLKDKKIFAICFLSILFQLIIYVFAYSTLIYPTRIFSAFLILIFGYWILYEQDSTINKKFISIILGVFFLFTTANGIAFIQKDFKYNYSSAKDTAQYIKNNTDKDSLIVPTADAFGIGVYYYLSDYKFYSVYKHNRIKYMIWNKEKFLDRNTAHIVFTKMLEDDIKKFNLKEKKIYILASNFMNANNFEVTMPEKYKLLYVSPPCFAIGEAFKIYEYKN